MYDILNSVYIPEKKNCPLSTYIAFYHTLIGKISTMLGDYLQS